MVCDKRQGGDVNQIEVTPEMISLAAVELWELVGDDGLTRKSPLTEFEWIIAQALSAARFGTAERTRKL